MEGRISALHGLRCSVQSSFRSTSTVRISGSWTGSCPWLAGCGEHTVTQGVEDQGRVPRSKMPRSRLRRGRGHPWTALQLERAATPRTAAWSRASDGARCGAACALGSALPGGGRGSPHMARIAPHSIAAGREVGRFRAAPRPRPREPIAACVHGSGWCRSRAWVVERGTRAEPTGRTRTPSSADTESSSPRSTTGASSESPGDHEHQMSCGTLRAEWPAKPYHRQTS